MTESQFRGCATYLAAFVLVYKLVDYFVLFPKIKKPAIRESALEICQEKMAKNGIFHRVPQCDCVADEATAKFGYVKAKVFSNVITGIIFGGKWLTDAVDASFTKCLADRPTSPP